MRALIAGLARLVGLVLPILTLGLSLAAPFTGGLAVIGALGGLLWWVSLPGLLVGARLGAACGLFALIAVRLG